MCGMSYRKCRQNRHDMDSILSVASRQEGILGSEISIRVAAHSEDITTKWEISMPNEMIVPNERARSKDMSMPNEMSMPNNAGHLYADERQPLAEIHDTRRPTMRAIVVTDQAAGRSGMKLVERPEPQGASLASLSGANYGDVVVQVHASGFTWDELSWPSTWVDRLGRDRTPSIPGHELAGVVTAPSYGTTGLSVGQRVFGLTDWTRDGTLAEYVAVEARNLAPLPGDVDFTVGAALVM